MFLSIFLACILTISIAKCGTEKNVDCKYSGSKIPICTTLHRNRTLIEMFGVIGNFGSGKTCERSVAKLIDHVARAHNEFYKRNRINNEELDYIVTLGNNAYNSGSPEDIDNALSKVYGKYIIHGSTLEWPLNSNDTYTFLQNTNSSPEFRFFPTLGTVDQNKVEWENPSSLPYTNYFKYISDLPPSDTSDFPGMWYSFSKSKYLNWFSLNSNGQLYTQKEWLKEALSESPSESLNIVFFHHNPVGSIDKPHLSMAMEYAQWGASMVMAAGDSDVYERLFLCDGGGRVSSTCKGIPYVLNSIGGHGINSIRGCRRYPGSIRSYDKNLGFVFGLLSKSKSGPPRPEVNFCLYSLENHGSIQDSWKIELSKKKKNKDDTINKMQNGVQNVATKYLFIALIVGILILCCGISIYSLTCWRCQKTKFMRLPTHINENVIPDTIHLTLDNHSDHHSDHQELFNHKDQFLTPRGISAIEEKVDQKLQEFTNELNEMRKTLAAKEKGDSETTILEGV